MESSFNPFNKPLEEIIAEDLLKLKEVSEGWYIDYKSKGIGIKDYAKHISAFANQHGGWLFIGITEDPTLLVAKEFNGIPKKEVSSEIVKIREAVSAHCSPPPRFELKCIKGEDKEINLTKNNSIIIIHIQKGFKTPYIHSSGKIYRRIAEQSTPEKDRYELNDLYLRAQKFQDDFQQKLKYTPFLFNPEKPRAYVYLFRDIYQEKTCRNLTLEKFREILIEQDSSTDTYLPFDNTFSAQNGFYARQIAKNNPSSDLLSLRWYNTADALIEIPLNMHHQGELSESIYKHETGIGFHRLLLKQKHHSSNIIDLSYLIGIMIASIVRFEKLMQFVCDDKKYYLKIRLRNFGGQIPFFPSEKYLGQIEKYGTPIIMEDEIWVPQGTNIDSITKCEIVESQPTLAVYIMSTFILHLCGVLPTFDQEEIIDILRATTKAAEISKLE